MKQKLDRIYVFTGPDGSGKSTAIKCLDQLNLPSIYCGKKRKSGIIFNSLSFLRRSTSSIPLISSITKFIFFVSELIDLCIVHKNSKHIFAYERHFIDRLVYLFEKKIAKNKSIFKKAAYLFEYSLFMPLINFYKYIFVDSIKIIFILAKPEELLERKPGDYSDLKVAQQRRKAYEMAYDWWIMNGGLGMKAENIENQDPNAFFYKLIGGLAIDHKR